MDNSTNTPHQAPKTKNAQKKSRKSGIIYLIGAALLATGGYFYGEKQGYFSTSGSDISSTSAAPPNMPGLKLSINPEVNTTEQSLEKIENSAPKKVASVPQEHILTEFTDISFTGNDNVLIRGKTVPSGRIRVQHGNSSQTSEANAAGSWTTLLSRKTSGSDMLTLEKETTKDSNKFVEVQRVKLPHPGNGNGSQKAEEATEKTSQPLEGGPQILSDIQGIKSQPNISFQQVNESGDEILDVDKIKRTPVASPEIKASEQTESAQEDQPKSWQDRIQKGIETFFGQSKKSKENEKANPETTPQILVKPDTESGTEPGIEKAARAPGSKNPNAEANPPGTVFNIPEPTLPGEKPTGSRAKTPGFRKVSEPLPRPGQTKSGQTDSGLLKTSQPGASSAADNENSTSSPVKKLNVARQAKKKSRRSRFKKRASLRKKRFKRRSRSQRRRKARRRAKLRRRARYKRRRVAFRGRKRHSRARTRQIRRARRIRARRGETLWGYARIRYGKGRYYRRIARRNGIRNPHRIRVGQRIRFR